MKINNLSDVYYTLYNHVLLYRLPDILTTTINSDDFILTQPKLYIKEFIDYNIQDANITYEFICDFILFTRDTHLQTGKKQYLMNAKFKLLNQHGTCES